MNPLVSVIMSVYNAEEWVAESVESILKQTYPHFELIIINDGSSDLSASILNNFNDPRIKIIHQENKGLGASLNIALTFSSGQYIARMDADDVALPNRFEKQVEFLNANPIYGLVGTNAEIIDYDGQSIGFFNHPLTSARLKYGLLWNTYFVSPSVMFRETCLKKAGLFYEKADLFEDYHMWSLLAEYCEVANLPDVLMRYRRLKTSISHVTKNITDRIINQRRINIRKKFPLFSKDIIDALAHCEFRRSPISSIKVLREIWKEMSKKMTEKVESKEEKDLILKDLSARMHTFRLFTPANRGILYFLLRIPERFIYSLIFR